MQNPHEHDLAYISRKRHEQRVISMATQDRTCLGFKERAWHVIGLVAAVAGAASFVLGIILVCVFKVVDEAEDKAPAIIGLLLVIIGALCLSIFVVYVCYIAKFSLPVFGQVKIQTGFDTEQQKLERKIKKKQEILSGMNFSTPGTKAFTNKAFALKGLRPSSDDTYA